MLQYSQLKLPQPSYRKTQTEIPRTLSSPIEVQTRFSPPVGEKLARSLTMEAACLEVQLGFFVCR
jgi:hypothetical protein